MRRGEGSMLEERCWLTRDQAGGEAGREQLGGGERQKDLLRQRISVHQSKATLVKATADVEAAELALQEYLSGSFRENEEQLESSEFVSKENLRRAQEYLVYSKKLAAKGYVSEAQLEADQFAVEKAGKELDLSQAGADGYPKDFLIASMLETLAIEDMNPKCEKHP